MDFIELTKTLGSLGISGILLYLLFLERKRADAAIADQVRLTEKVAAATVGTAAVLQAHQLLTEKVLTVLADVKECALWLKQQAAETRTDLQETRDTVQRLTGDRWPAVDSTPTAKDRKR